MVNEEEKKPRAPTLPDVLWTLAGLIFKREALLVVASGVLLMGVGGAGVVWAQGKLDGGVAPVRDELRRHVAEQDSRNDAQAHFNERVMEALQKMEDRSARRFDALQNTVLERREQPEARELARPAPIVAPDGSP